MSRASRRAVGRRQPAQGPAPATLTPRSDAAPFGGIGYGTMGYQGAAWSTDRGYVYWPTLDPQKEIDTWTRLEIARKAHWACANIGLPRRIRTGVTNLVVGTGLLPHATTKDTAWNQLAESAYKTRGNSPLAYSVNGRHTSPQSQRLMESTMLTDGDAAVVYAESQSGGALRQFYSGVQIGNASMQMSDPVAPTPMADPAKWHDGILYDALDRARTYRFPDSQGEGFTDIDAQNVRFLYRCEAPGQRRGVSIFAHAMNKFVDITERNRFMMAGIKSSSQIGYYFTSNSDEKRSGMLASLGDPTQMSQIVNGAGQPINVTLKQVYGQGGMIPSLPKGIDLKTLLDTRPHPNQEEFIQEFIRDISWGSGIAPELLWNITKLGGANTRFVLADAQVFLASAQQDLVDTWLASDWVWTIAKEMKSGRLRPCQDPTWWAHGWIPPARVTVDFGRDGRIMLEFHKYGLLTTTRFFGMQGLTARTEITGELELIAFRKEEMARLGLVPLDLQIYNPMIARVPPEQPGDEDYGEEVPGKGKRPGANRDEDDGDEGEEFDESASYEQLRRGMRAQLLREMEQIAA